MGEGVLTAGFSRPDGTLHAEGVSLSAVAAAVGTPAWVYSAAALRSRVAALEAVLAGTPHRVHYAVKANATLGVLRVLREAGVAADVVSGGELHLARLAGFAAADIVFDGPGKSEEELAAALDAGVKVINVESREEAELLARVAAAGRVVAPVGLRVNPEVTIENFHEYIATGEEGDKFGIPYDEAFGVAAWVATQPSLALVGVHMHVGSQLTAFEGFEQAIEKLAQLIDRIRAELPAAARGLRYVDLGGGLPVAYADGDPDADLAAYGAVVRRAHDRTGCEILLEPGRLLVADAGVLLTRVRYRKRSGGVSYVVVDAGMNELIRPPLYEAYHAIEAVAGGEATETVDVVGPVCESGDFLGLGRALPPVVAGDLVAVRTAGAYGSVMSSNYNARPRAAEVLVDGARWAVVRRRETLDDLARLDVAAPEWRDG